MTPRKPTTHVDVSTDPQNMSTRQILLVLHNTVALTGLAPGIEVRVERMGLVPIGYNPNSNILYVDPIWQNSDIMHCIFPCTELKLAQGDCAPSSGLCDHLLEELAERHCL